MKKVYLLLILLVGMVLSGYAQSKSFEEIQKRQRERFAQMKSAQQAEFDAFRKECNDRYSEMMRKNWEQFNAFPAVEPKEEKPVPPVVYEEPAPQPEVKPEEKPAPQPEVKPEEKPAPKLEDKPIAVKEVVIVIPKPAPQPQPLAPVAPKEEIPFERVSVSFYGTLVSIGFPVSDDLKLQEITEKHLADTWTSLSDEKYDITIDNALSVRKNLALCDWAYIEMLGAVCEKKYGKTNEAVLMQGYVLSQSGKYLPS